MTSGATQHRERVEKQFLDLAEQVQLFVAKNEARIVRNLLSRHLEGSVDAGIFEGFHVEQVEGINAFLEDMLEAANHLELVED